MSHDFAKRLAQLRKERQWTQKQVAEALGIPHSTYKEWEYGRKIQGEGIYVRMADLFGISLRSLLIGAQTQPPQRDFAERLQQVIREIESIKKDFISAL
ncbi:MAG: helix-turn-helix transcriptional regulator [Bdellovibrio sp.]